MTATDTPNGHVGFVTFEARSGAAIGGPRLHRRTVRGYPDRVERVGTELPPVRTGVVVDPRQAAFGERTARSLPPVPRTKRLSTRSNLWGDRRVGSARATVRSVLGDDPAAVSTNHEHPRLAFLLTQRIDVEDSFPVGSPAGRRPTSSRARAASACCQDRSGLWTTSPVTRRNAMRSSASRKSSVGVRSHSNSLAANSTDSARRFANEPTRVVVALHVLEPSETVSRRHRGP